MDSKPVIKCPCCGSTLSTKTSDVLRVSESRLLKIRTINPHDIVTHTAEFFEIKTSVLFSGFRGRKIVMCRKYIAWFLWNYNGFNKSEIARVIGMDHTSIMWLLKEMGNHIEKEPTVIPTMKKLFAFILQKNKTKYAPKRKRPSRAKVPSVSGDQGKI